MQETIPDVRGIDATDREALGHVVGQELRDDQRIMISVMNMDVAAPSPEQMAAETPGLPPWCNVYEGFTNEEIDEIEKSIVRAPGGHTFE